MANATVSGNDIKVHYRGSFRLDYKATDVDGVQVDASAWNLWLEIDGIALREKLVADPEDPLGQMVVLENAQILLLPTAPIPFIIRDETDLLNDEPIVLQEGTISGYGYKNAPDGTVG